MKKRKLHYLGFVLALGAMPFISQAQQKIGGTVGAADANAYLQLGDATGANKGLLLSRVALTATNATAPLTAHVAGMTVYNTATAGTGATAVTPGYYYNDGTKWVRMASMTDFAANAWLPGGNTNGALKTIGTNDNFDIPFVTNNAEKMRLTTGGYLGMGTTTPNSRLTLVNDNKGELADDIQVSTFSNATTPSLILDRTRGTVAAPANMQNGDGIGNLKFRAQVNNTMTDVSGMWSAYKGNGTNNSSDLSLYTSGQTRLYINENGNVGVGTTTANNRLTVDNGKFQYTDGSQGDSKVLTSDANGVATWKVNAPDLYYASLGNGVDIQYNQNGWAYSNTSITLPPGKWLLSANLVFGKTSRSSDATASNESWWIRGTFCDNSSSFSFSSDIQNGNKYFSGTLAPSSYYGMMTGGLVINNTSGANKTYYFWAGYLANLNASGFLYKFGASSATWTENYITYQRVN